MDKFSEHKNLSYCAVFSAINGDADLSNVARRYVRAYCDKGMLPAAFGLLQELHDMGITHTTDGTRYTVINLRAVLAGM